MLVPARPGQRIPDSALAELRDGDLVTTRSETLFAGRNAVVLGVPGAFTPVCSQRHLPDFIQNAGRLKASGFDSLFCIAPNDPWVLDRWARDIDPGRKVRFLSDGNLDFTRRLGLLARHDDLHLGERSRRYTMIVRNAVIEKLAVETSILDYACSRSEAVVL